MKIKKKLIVGILLSVSGSAQAGCGNSFNLTVNTLMANIPAEIVGIINSTGSMASETGQQGEIMQIASTMNAISRQFSSCIDDNITEIEKQAVVTRQTLSKLFKFTNDAIYKDFVEFGTAQQKAEARRTFGEQSRTTSLCNGPELATGVMSGHKTQKETQKSIREKIENKATHAISQSASIKHIQKAVKETDITHEMVAPIEGSLSEKEMKKAIEINAMIMNPLPPVVLNETLLNTPDGIKYEVGKKILRANQLTAEHVKEKVLASHATNYDLGQWANDVWENMGNTGDAPGVIDGKISNEALLNLLVDARFRSAPWYQKLNGESTSKESGGNLTWLKRQRLTGNIILLEIQKQQLEYTRLMAELVAENRANDISKNFTPTLDLLRNAAIKNN